MMKKIMVIGCPGSGKSRFSEELHNKTGISLYHLDMMYWNEDKTVVEREEFIRRMLTVLKKDEWIIDGNYSSTMDIRMSECDTVFFLDYPTGVCLDGIKQRRGKPRTDMPWIETEEDAEFIEFIKTFNEHEKPKILELFKKHSHKDVIVFTKREQATEFLARL